MKYISIIFILILFSITVFTNPGLVTPFKDIAPESQHKRASQLITHILTTNHYHKKSIDDSLSTEVFNRFIQKLDYGRLYFLKSDIKAFKKYRYDFDDYVKYGQLATAFEIFNIYQQRVAERLEYSFERLKTEFDYSIDEEYQVDRKDAMWATSRAELDELWRKRLKAAALNLKLAGKNWEKISETLIKRYKRIEKNVSQLQSEDVFQILMNSFSESFDPHTNYFSPKNFDNFKISMSQSFEGIGARLMSEDDFTKVTEIIVGGPADKGKQLFAGDKIIGVAQGEDGEMIDVVGWRLDDVVQLIRGEKGTLVQLQILAAGAAIDALPDTISIVRDKIKLKDQTPYSDTLKIDYEGRNFSFGVITIPTFYSDFDGRRKGDPDYKSTTRDVKILLEELKGANVDGIIVDLRRNGGGFLNEAVDLTGLFIDKGPVVQVRNNNGSVNVEWDTKPGMVYAGPLAVIINGYSASASEIFAAAIQDYKRGIIIGDKSFGKGTVQRPIDLNQILRNSNNQFGQIKLTTAKFYRVNGGSTQHVGVMPDISLPSRFKFLEVGESSRENALLWDKITPINYDIFTDNSQLLSQLSTRHDLRLANDPDYKMFLNDLAEFEIQSKKKTISLNEEKRKQEKEKSKKNSSLENSFTEIDDDSTNSNGSEEKEPDILLEESLYVLGDYILLSGQKK
ncbi:carboxy terminal-processing peptidase [Calditrichota bacterium]